MGEVVPENTHPWLGLCLGRAAVRCRKFFVYSFWRITSRVNVQLAVPRFTLCCSISARGKQSLVTPPFGRRHYNVLAAVELSVGIIIF